MINPPSNSHQIAASGSFLVGNTDCCSGSYLIGQGRVGPKKSVRDILSYCYRIEHRVRFHSFFVLARLTFWQIDIVQEKKNE
jgi:hypothetical protein